MKRILKAIVTYLLALGARAVIRRYHPTVVMVTGSVGKTSTKDAVAAVLETNFYIRKSEKSFNSQFGVPFTIFGVSNPWGNPIGWIKVTKCVLALLLLPNHYPKMLVLEVGADKPGDLAHILSIVTPHVVVVTRLPEIPVHVEAYTSPDAVREEEFSPAYALSAGAPLIVPVDDLYALDMATRTSARVITYGLTPEAFVCVDDLGFYEQEGRVAGMKTSVKEGNSTHEILIKGAVGRTQLLPVAAALAVAQALQVPIGEACEALMQYEAPPGRGRLFVGKNGSTIIDDSYNSSPAAVEEALAMLKSFPMHPPAGGRRIAVLGDMLELGRYSVMEHERIGTVALEAADLVATVGVRARAFALAPGKAETIVFENSYAAASALRDMLREGDVVLVKGSQSIRTERIVEALLADPADSERLVRQERQWKRRA